VLKKRFLVVVEYTKFDESPSDVVSELFPGDGWKIDVTRLTDAYHNR